MRSQENAPLFHSVLAEVMGRFLAEKRACGYRYEAEFHQLRQFDRFLCQQPLTTLELSREAVEEWIKCRIHERPRTHTTRISMVRQLACYMQRHKLPAYVPPRELAPLNHLDFTPYIFTHDQIQRLFKAADELPFDPRSPLRHLVIPELLRLLYGCGLRLSEPLHLLERDVDLDAGVLTIRMGKFRKDRLVPMAPPMARRLSNYVAALGRHAPEMAFFPTRRGTSYHPRMVYNVYRQLLRSAGISHGGRGQGPRLHDLRHTFAVHRLAAWYRQGVDLNAMLPVLAAYLGHETLSGTQRYLQITPELFPNITAGLESVVGHVVPRREAP